LHPLHTYSNPTIASDGERIYAAFPNYGLVAYKVDGTKLWEYPHEIVSTFYYTGASSPVIADSIVIYLVSSRTDPRIVGLDCLTGDSIWTIRDAERSRFSAYSCATPVIHDSLLIFHTSNAVVAYNMPAGKAVWWLNTPTTAVGTPVIDDNTLFLNSWLQGGEKIDRGEFLSFSELLKKCDKNANGKIEQVEFGDDMPVYERSEYLDGPYSSMYFKDDMFFRYYDLNKNQAMEESEWNAMLEFAASYFTDHGMLAISLEGEGRRPVTDILWKVNKDTPETPSPLVVGENVFFIKDGGIMTVINKESGDVIHNKRVGASGGYLSSPILAGNKIITCSYNGIVTVISAEDYRILAHNKLKEKIGASPVAVDDVLYIRTDKHLYAFRDQ
jgi:outer membrane protein assembly factor BamB